MASSWENVEFGKSKMPIYLSVPESGGPVPGIVVVHGQSGLENFIKDTTHMFALQGYVAAAPNLYHRDGPDCKDDNPTRKARLRVLPLPLGPWRNTVSPQAIDSVSIAMTSWPGR